MADNYVFDKASENYDADYLRKLIPKTNVGSNALDALARQQEREIRDFERQFTKPRRGRYIGSLSKEEQDLLTNLSGESGVNQSSAFKDAIDSSAPPRIKKLAAGVNPAANSTWESVRASIQDFDKQPASTQKLLHDTFVKRKAHATGKPVAEIRRESEAPEEPSRSLSEWVTDPLLGGLEGAMGLTKTLTDVVAPESALSEMLGRGIEAARDLSSDVEKNIRKEEEAQIEDYKQTHPDASELDLMANEFKVSLDPSNISIGDIGSLVGGIAPAVGAGRKVAQKVLERVLARETAKGVSKEVAEQTAKKAAVRAGFVAGSAIEGASTAGDVRGSFYEKVMSIPTNSKLLDQNDSFNSYLARERDTTAQLRGSWSDADELAARERAKARLALDSRGAAALAGGAAAILSATGLERIAARVGAGEGASRTAKLSGKALETAGTGVSEAIAEGAPQAASNYAVREIDPSQRLGEGVGTSAGMGMLGGVGGHVVTGGLTNSEEPTTSVPPSKPQPTVADEVLETVEGANAPEVMEVFGTQIVINANGRAAYAEGASPNAEADEFIANMNLAAEPEAAEAAPTAPVAEPAPTAPVTEPTAPVTEPTAPVTEPTAPVTEPTAIEPAPTSIPEARTGVPFTLQGWRGTGASPEQIYTGAQVPIAGRGFYVADDEADARGYGPTVTAEIVTLQNPLVVRSDDEWRALTRSAGWPFPNPSGSSEERVNVLTEALRQRILSQGHDGLIVSVPESEVDGRTLQRVFGHSQVVSYAEPAPTAPVTEPAPTAPAAEPAPTAPVTEPAPTAPVTEPAPTAPATEQSLDRPTIFDVPAPDYISSNPRLDSAFQAARDTLRNDPNAVVPIGANAFAQLQPDGSYAYTSGGRTTFSDTVLSALNMESAPTAPAAEPAPSASTAAPTAPSLAALEAPAQEIVNRLAQRNPSDSLRALTEADTLIRRMTPEQRSDYTNAPAEALPQPLRRMREDMGLLVEVSAADANTPWVRAVTTAANPLAAVANDPTAGAANREAAATVETLFNETGIPVPPASYTTNRPNYRGSYSPTSHTVSFNPSTTASTVPHEYLHALTVRGLDRLRNTQEGRSLLSLLTYIRSQIPSINPRVYAAASNAELIAELFRPQALAYLSQQEYDLTFAPPDVREAAERLLNTPPRGNLLDLMLRAITKVLRTINPNASINENSLSQLLVRAASEAIAGTQTAFSIPQTPRNAAPAPTAPVAEPDPFLITAEITEPPPAPAPAPAPAPDQSQRTTNPQLSTAVGLSDFEGIKRGTQKLLALGRLWARGVGGAAFRGGAPDHSRTIAASASASERVNHFKTLLEENLQALNQQRNPDGSYTRWSIVDLYGSQPKIYTEAVAADGTASPRVQVANFYSVLPRGGSSERALPKLSFTTLGFENDHTYRQPNSNGGKFYELINTLALLSRTRLKSNTLTVANIRRLPVNRTRAMLRNAAFLPASEAGRVLSTLQMSARQNRQHRPIAETGSHLANTIRPLIAAVQQKLGNVVWNPEDRGYYINGVKHDRSEFLSLLQAAGSSATDNTASPDVVALIAVFNSLAKGIATPNQVAARFPLSDITEANGTVTPAEGPIFSRQESAAEGMTVAGLRDKLKGFLGSVAAKLEQKGLLQIVQSEQDAIEAMAQARAKKSGRSVEAERATLQKQLKSKDPSVQESLMAGVEGLFDKQSGVSFLIADNLTSETARGVLLHEVGVHMASDGTLTPFFDKALALVESGEGDFFQGVKEHMASVGETSGEEAMAYIVAGHQNAPASVKKLISDFIATVKQWLRSKGILTNLGKLTPADFAAIARANTKRVAAQEVLSSAPEELAEKFPLEDMTDDYGDAVDAEAPLLSRRSGGNQRGQERDSFDTLTDNIRSGQALPPASPQRALWQSLWAARNRSPQAQRRAALDAIGQNINESFHDHLAPVQRFAEDIGDESPTLKKLSDRLIGAMRMAPGIRDGILKRMTEVEGGEQMYKALFKIAKLKHLTEEDALGYAGFWLTAKRAAEGNRRLLKRDSEAVTAARRAAAQAASAVQAAQNMIGGDVAGAMEQEAAANRALAKAVTQLANRAADINGTSTFRKAGVAGFSNPQAAAMIQLIESKIPVAMLQEVAKHVYHLNASRLLTDIASGRVAPSTVAEFLEKPALAAELQAFVQASQAATAESPTAQQDLQAMRDQLLERVKSDYVPMTGDPEASLYQDVVSRAGQPNTARERAMEGRTDSIPDDGITASIAGWNRSASYAGWSKFQDALADMYNGMTEAQRKAHGIEQEVAQVTDRDSGSGRNAVIRIRGKRKESYSFKNPKILEAIRNETLNSPDALIAGVGDLTRTYAYAATQLAPWFPPRNMLRDLGERADLLISSDLTDAQGNPVSGFVVAKRTLYTAAKRLFPLLKVGFQYALNGKTKGDSLESRYFQEMLDGGAVSFFAQRFHSSRLDAIKQLAKQGKLGQSKKALGHLVELYNRPFDMVAPLATYSALRQSGVPKEQALAKTLDLMNFRKKGSKMKFIASVYPFAQTSATGGANLLSSLGDLRTGKVRPFALARLAGYTTALLFLRSMLLAAADEDEGGNKLLQLPDYDHDNNILIPFESGVAKIPLPFGLVRIANGLVNHALNVGSKDEKLMEGVSSLILGSVVPAFAPLTDSPIDGDKYPFQKMLMTFVPPIVGAPTRVALGMTAYGQPLRNQYADKDKFISEQPKPSTPADYTEMAKTLRRATGIDMAPEEIRELIKGYPIGPLHYARTHFLEEKSAADEARKPVFTDYPEYARYFQYKRAEDDALSEFKKQEAGDKKLDYKKLDWYEEVTKKNGEFKSRKSKITKNKMLSEEVKEEKKGAIDAERNAFQNEMLYRWRTEVMGQDAKWTGE